MNVGTDVAVVGAGIVGLATAYALKEKGTTVSVYDRARPGSGQSGGDSRIFRHGHEDRRLVEWARRSRSIYRRWEEEFGVELVSADGALFFGDSAARRLRSIESVGGVDARLIDADEVAERMPLLVRREESALFDADGGLIRAADAVAALGARLEDALVREEVVAILPRPGGTVELLTGGGRVEHGSVVVCAGTFTATVARGLGVRIPMKVTLHGRVAFDVRGEPPACLACMSETTGDFGEPDAYGVASPDHSRYSIGVGETPTREDLSLSAAHEIAEVDERAAAFVAKALPGLDPTPVAHRHCFVTELPWHEDAIGVWDVGPVHLLAGNNLFKHAPALGDALATAALGGGLATDLRPEARLGADAIPPPWPGWGRLFRRPEEGALRGDHGRRRSGLGRLGLAPGMSTESAGCTDRSSTGAMPESSSTHTRRTSPPSEEGAAGPRTGVDPSIGGGEFLEPRSQGIMGSPSDPLDPDERRRLLDSLRRGLVEDGHDALTIVTVAGRAGMDIEAFHRHFETLEDCCLAAFDRTARELNEAVAEAFEEGEGWSTGVGAAVLAALDFFAATPESAHLFLVYPLFAEPAILMCQREHVARLTSILVQGRSLAPWGEELPESLECGLLGGVAFQISGRVRRGEAPRLPELAPDVIQFVLTPYIGVDEARRVSRR